MMILDMARSITIQMKKTLFIMKLIILIMLLLLRMAHPKVQTGFRHSLQGTQCYSEFRNVKPCTKRGNHQGQQKATLMLVIYILLVSSNSL